MNIFNFIKNNIPILEVVQEYTNLKQTGTYWKGICPFHSERTPSFTVSPHKDIYYCFGCQSGGDVVSFIAKAENCSQFEASKFLSEKYNKKIPDELLKEVSEHEFSMDTKKKYHKLCYLITLWCNRNLLKNKKALKYLEDRNITTDIIEKFLIGYFEPGHIGLTSLNNFLKKENFLFQDLAEFSIILEGNSGFYSPFEERIIFPIQNSLGEFCAFGGRIFKETDERPKYYNSKENPYFSKGSILFGLYSAKKTIQKEKAAFLVEGYTDHLAMYKAGYKNTVATLGTACTLEHLKLLSRFANRLYVVFDSDTAGQNAALKLTELAWNVNIEVKIISLPNEEDPASFFGKKLDFKDLVNKSRNIYQFFIASAKSEFSNSSLSERVQRVQKIVNIIDQLQDPIKKTLLLQEVAQEFGISLDLIRRKNISNEIVAQRESLSLEQAILGGVLQDYNRINYLQDLECLDFFQADIKEVLILISKNDKLDLKQFINLIDKEDIKKLTLKCYMQYDLSFNFENLIKQFQKKNWKKIISKIKNDLSQETDSKEKHNKLEKLKNLQLKIISGSHE
jgi:DNA primase